MEDEKTQLEARIAKMIAELALALPACREGVVMTIAGPPPYRRVDCDGRALAYFRTRPRRHMVRIDVSSLWLAPPEALSILVPGATGMALCIRSDEDAELALRFLKRIVQHTRKHRPFVSPAVQRKARREKKPAA